MYYYICFQSLAPLWNVPSKHPRSIFVLSSLRKKEIPPDDDCCEECPPIIPLCEPPKNEVDRGDNGKVRLKEPIKGKVRISLNILIESVKFQTNP